ncbi:hypothetical protein H4R19_004249 [Coemansia spiralis]|nr:hypothetical protein H4R19_004249 [Coemansia spiralis]
MPKNAMSVAIGLAHALCILVSLLMTFLALPVGSDGKNPRPKSLGARHKPLFKQRLLFLFHVTLGTFIISDPLFLKEKEPSDSAGPIGKVLYQLLISGAACQAAGVVTTFAVQAITPE